MLSVQDFSFSRVDCPRDHMFKVQADVVNGKFLSRTVHLPPEETRGPGAADLRTKDTKRDLIDKFEEESRDDLHVYTGIL